MTVKKKRLYIPFLFHVFVSKWLHTHKTYNERVQLCKQKYVILDPWMVSESPYNELIAAVLLKFFKLKRNIKLWNSSVIKLRFNPLEYMMPFKGFRRHVVCFRRVVLFFGFFHSAHKLGQLSTLQFAPSALHYPHRFCLRVAVSHFLFLCLCTGLCSISDLTSRVCLLSFCLILVTLLSFIFSIRSDKPALCLGCLWQFVFTFLLVSVHEHSIKAGT